MSRMLFLAVLAAAVWLIPDPLTAGGPPRLCVPIDGVTSRNADACTQRLATGLELQDSPLRSRQVETQRLAQGAYASFYLGRDVKLSEIDAALNGTGFSVPRERLRLFGHARLVVETGPNQADALIRNLDAIPYVSIDESQRTQGRLLVTVDMPYPTSGKRNWQQIASEEIRFRRNDFSLDRSTRSESPVTSRDLPSCRRFQEVASKHNAQLHDVIWSPRWACRLLGGVAVSRENA